MIPEELKQKRKEMTSLAKQQRNKLQYEKTKENLMRCDICCVECNKYYWEKHIATVRHIKWSKLHEEKKQNEQNEKNEKKDLKK